MLVNARAAHLHRYGAPVVLKFEGVVIAEPGGGEVLVRNRIVGPKFVDVYFRRGSMEVPSFPAVIGDEAAGIVEAVGCGVMSVEVGDRVVFGHSTGCGRTPRKQRSLLVGYTWPKSKRDSNSIAKASIIESGNACARGYHELATSHAAVGRDLEELVQSLRAEGRRPLSGDVVPTLPGAIMGHNAPPAVRDLDGAQFPANGHAQ
jgi:hypothetical protein